MGRLSLTAAQDMHKRKDTFFTWLDEHPAKARYSEWGGSQRLFKEYNTANPSLTLRTEKDASRWLHEYRQLRQIKPQYLQVKTLERLRALEKKMECIV